MANVFRPLILSRITGKVATVALLTVGSSLLETTLAPAAPANLPVGQVECAKPAPLARRGELAIQPPPLVLNTMFVPPVKPPAGAVLDLPRTKPRTIQPSSWRPTSAVPAPYVPFPFGTVFDLPVVVPKANIGLKTFLRISDSYLVPTQVGVAPFLLQDWPVPQKKASAIDLRWSVDGFSTTLIGKDALPFLQTEWPLPKVKGRPLDGFIAGVDLNLVNQDVLTGLPGQAPSYLPPLPPVGPTPHRDLRTWVQGTVAILTLPPPVRPPLGYEWLIPAQRPYPTSLRFHTAFYVVDDSAPFAQTEWTLPQARPYLRQILHHCDVLERVLLSADVLPYRQNGWEVPTGKEFPRDLRTYVLPMQGQLAGQDALPFFETKWPLPTGKPYPVELRTFLQALNKETTGTDVLPFYQTAWPLPTGKAPARFNWTQEDRLKVLLRGKDVLFGAPGQVIPYDWKNPQGKPFPVALRTFLHVTNQSILIIPAHIRPSLTADASANNMLTADASVNTALSADASE